MKQFIKFTIALIMGIVALGFQSCGSDDDEPTKPSEFSIPTERVSLNKGKITEVTISGNTDDCRVFVNDEFHASAYLSGSTLTIMGGYVGNTKVIVSNGAKTQDIEVEVLPTNKSINVPYLKWGESIKDVKKVLGSVSEEGNSVDGYFLKVKGVSPIWSDETYYFANDALVAVHSEVHENFNSVADPIMIFGERFKVTNKTYSGYNHYDWFEKPNETQVRLCTFAYGDKYACDIWYSSSADIIEIMSPKY